MSGSDKWGLFQYLFQQEELGDYYFSSISLYLITTIHVSSYLICLKVYINNGFLHEFSDECFKKYTMKYIKMKFLPL